MTLTTAVVVGVGDLLNGANTAASLADKPPASPVLSTGAADLRVPQPIVWFGVEPIILVALLLLIVLVVAELARRKATKDNSIIEPPPVAVVPPEHQPMNSARPPHESSHRSPIGARARWDSS